MSVNTDDLIRRLAEVSWSFSGVKSRSEFSSLHFYPGRFISQVPSTLISYLSEPGDNIFDPFNGSGTTVVEAQRLGRCAVGLDVHPVCAVISRGKTVPLNAREVGARLGRFLNSFAKARSRTQSHPIPPSVQVTKWYSDYVAHDLAALFCVVNRSNDEYDYALRAFCFSAILLTVCRETRHWGYVCDNTKPSSHPPRDVVASLVGKSGALTTAYTQRDAFLNGGEPPEVIIHTADAKDCVNLLGRESIDLVVTSPPYLGVVDYVKSQRLTMEWLGHDIEQYRLVEAGARSKRRRKSSEEEFRRYLRISFEAITTTLKRDGTCAVLFGASSKRPFADDELIKILEKLGMEKIFSTSREISVGRRLKPSITEERLHIFRKRS